MEPASRDDDFDRLLEDQQAGSGDAATDAERATGASDMRGCWKQCTDFVTGQLTAIWQIPLKCANLDIILDHFSCLFQLYTTPTRHPCGVRPK